MRQCADAAGVVLEFAAVQARISDCRVVRHIAPYQGRACKTVHARNYVSAV
jgi:hypothetical protein